MDILDAYKLVDTIAAKERGGYVTTEEKNQAFADANLDLFNACIKEYGVSTWANEALAPFKKQPYLEFQTDASGAFAIDPSENYAHLLGIEIVESHPKYGILKHRTKIVNEDEISDRESSVLHQPTLTNPCALIAGGIGAFQFYPQQVLAGRIRFLRYPQTPKLVETQEGRTLIYDQDSSVQMEWSESLQRQLIFKALVRLGINLDSDKLVQYSDALAKSNI